jgi:hypothetical protein
MKFELTRPIDYTEDAILIEIRRVAFLVDKPLTIAKFEQNSKYSSYTVKRKFKNWKNALEKAGLDKSYINTNYEKVTKDELIKEFKRVSDILGRNSFTEKEFENISHISRSIISRKFGSFKKIMNEMGFITPLKSRKYTDDERYENLLKVWTFYGRQPNYSEMKKEPSMVGPKAYVTRWGSWTKALIAFIEKMNTDVTNESLSETNFEENIVEKTKEKISKEDKREISIGLRFDILKRDNYKCVLCGRSPSSNINIELHIDHIIPFSKGGKTKESNLRTLCNQCNIGKSNKIDL